MKKIVTLILMLVVSTLGLRVSAQAETLPYQVNFESNETAEMAQWTLNPGANPANVLDKWMVGTSVHSAGRQALYISNNNADAQFDSVPCIQYAYRDILLPQGKYDFSFDWLCVGASSSALYVGFEDFTTAEKNLMVTQTHGAFNTALKNAMLSFPGYTNGLKGADTWQNASTTIYSDGLTVYRLVFVWVNGNTSKANNNVGACIDNIVITNANCKRPLNVSAQVISCDSVLVTWAGTSASYELEYRASGTDNWITKRNIQANGTKGSLAISNMSEGNYDFRVRGICTPDTSAWAYCSGFVVFCPEIHCVNFTDLHAANVTCTYGTTDYESSYWGGSGNINYNNPANRAHAYDHVGVIDFGSDSKQSRHTVNWDKTATDPRTDNGLKLIPDGGYASVRLGNWEYGNGAESVTYKYAVDSASAVLLMQYAVVLEYPSGHDDHEMPRFVLEILDENDNLLDPTCGVRNFFAMEADGVNWKSAGGGGYYGDAVVYKPWTTVGLNLFELGVKPGDVIKVRLTTYDCFLSGHYGYAYFTLDCAQATIETAACQKDVSLTMSLVAPDGFKYQWYDKTGKALPGETNRTYFPSDTATYRCRLTSTEEESCYFDLYSQCFPRLPMPQFKPTYVIADCQNKIQMENTSYIRVFQPDGVINLEESCDSYLWETWGTTSDGKTFSPMLSDHESPIFEYPDEGGDFFVKLTATIAGSCSEDTVMPIHIAPIRSYDMQRDTILCRPANTPDYYLEIDGQQVTNSGLYTIHYKTIVGCDSVITWNVIINESPIITLSDTTICYGESICYGDSCIGPNTPSVYKSGMWIWNHMRTTSGCDSTIMRKVTLKDEIKPVITCNGEDVDLPDGRVDVFGDDVTVDLEIGGTGYDGYTMTYTDPTGQQHIEQHTPADTRLEGLAVNEYKFVFFNNNGCEYNASVLVGGDTLCLNLLSQIECACGEAVLHIPYRKCEPANKARISTCSVFFSETDKAEQGFEDALFTGLHAEDTIRIAVPAGAEPGLYAVDLVFDTIIGGCIWGQNAFHTNILLTYDSSVIFHRWNENAIISLAGPTAAKKHDGSDYELYAFSDFQWLRNGEEVENETRSYMEQPGVLNLEDAFALRMKRADGQVFTTCPYIPGHNRNANYAAPKASIVVSPSDPLAGSSVEVTLTDDAEIELYSIMGTKVMSRQFTKGISTFTTPSAQGVYILKAYMRGEAQTLMLRVR